MELLPRQVWSLLSAEVWGAGPYVCPYVCPDGVAHWPGTGTGGILFLCIDDAFRSAMPLLWAKSGGAKMPIAEVAKYFTTSKACSCPDWQYRGRVRPCKPRLGCPGGPCVDRGSES